MENVHLRVRLGSALHCMRCYASALSLHSLPFTSDTPPRPTTFREASRPPTLPPVYMILLQLQTACPPPPIHSPHPRSAHPAILGRRRCVCTHPRHALLAHDPEPQGEGANLERLAQQHRTGVWRERGKGARRGVARQAGRGFLLGRSSMSGSCGEGKKEGLCRLAFRVLALGTMSCCGKTGLVHGDEGLSSCGVRRLTD